MYRLYQAAHDFFDIYDDVVDDKQNTIDLLTKTQEEKHATNRCTVLCKQNEENNK